MTNSGENGAGKARKRGNRLGFWWFRLCLKLLGLRGAYLFLHIPCSYYLLFDRAAVRMADLYIRRRFPESGRLRRRLAVYRLFIMQGKVLIDRHCMLHRPDMFHLEFHGYEQIKESVENPDQGLVLLMSHTGNWQAILSAISHLRRPVCLLMRPEDNASLAEVLRLNDSEREIRFLSPDQFLGGVVELMQLIDAGYLISIMGDRSYGHSAVDVDYLGDKAEFPFGAFQIAAAAECPVLTLLSSKYDATRYDIEVGFCFTPRYKDRRKKRNSLKEWTQSYAQLLECYSKEHPYQCFLFHDIWKEDERHE